MRSALGTDAARRPTRLGGRSPIGTPDETVDLVAVRADDELLDAITHGRSVASSDPIESLLIQLLLRMARLPGSAQNDLIRKETEPGSRHDRCTMRDDV